MKRKLLLAALCVVGALGFKAQAQIVSGTTYYLQNKASGRFISSGYGWFTRSTLSPVLDYPIQLNASGDGYILKVVGSNQLGHNLFVDNGSNNVWTVTAVAGEENVYTIANGSNYLGSDGSLVLSGSLTDATSDAAKWYIRTKDDYLAMFPSASAENPVDASFYITGPSYDYTDTNRGNAWTMSGFGAGTELTRGSGTTAINPYVVECYNGTGSIKQTLTGLKKGMYAVSVYGFYRAGNNNTAPGSTAQNAIMYVGTEEKPLKSIYDEAKPSSVSGSFDTNTSAGYVPNVRSTAGEAFANGYYKNTIYIYVENDNTDIEIGVKKEATIAQDWTVIDNWCMTYYGEEELSATEIELAASVKAYNEALAAAQAYQSVDMFDADKTVLNTAISDNTLDLSGSVTEEQLTTAAANLNAAAAAAATAAAKYATYNTAVTTINGGTNVDLTSLIVNPSFESSFVGWTNNGLAAQGNTSFGKTGSIYAEKWEPNGTFGVSQTIGALPAGLYELTADVKARSVTSAKVFAAGIEQTVTIGDVQNTYTVSFALDDKAEALIGFEGVGTGLGNSWLCVDNFTLKYVGALPSELTAVEGKMNATVAAAQTTAVEAYNTTQTVANYNAAQAAIANAQASVAAYKTAATAIADAKALQTNNNFVTPDAATTFAEAIANIETPYNEGTLADADAAVAGNTLGVAAVGWHAAATNTPASNYMISAWPNNYTINDWSVEGVSDGSNYLVPFFQDWIADDNHLAEKTLTGTLTGLDNGLYEVSAWVRVRATNGTNAADVTGITMDVNGGGEGDYAAVDVTEGTQVGSTQFQLGTYTAKGLVKNGTLTVNFNVLSTCSSSWLSFKNVKYTKVRDLTEEEAFVAATEDDYAALNEAIDAHVFGFEADEYAPYNNIEAAATIAAAKAIDQTAQNAQEDVQAATAAITGATWTANIEEVNAVFDGSFEYDYSGQSGNINPIGWLRVKGASADGYNVRYMNGSNAGLAATSSGKALFTKQSAYYGYADGYTMPLKADTWYKVTFVYGGWGDCKKDGYVSMAAPDGSAVELSATDLPVDATNADADASAWKSYTAIFKTGEAGNYVLGLRKKSYDTSGQSQYVYGDITLFRATDDDLCESILAEAYALYENTEVPEVNVGTGAFQYNEEKINTYKAYVAQYATDKETLKAALKAAGQWKPEVLSQTLATIKNFVAEMQTLNAPADNQLFNIINVSEGYNHAGKAVTFKSASNADLKKNTTAMGWTELPGSIYPQSVKFTAVENETNTYTLSYTRADGYIIYVSTGLTSGLGSTNTQIRPTTDASKALKVKVEASATQDKVWYLWNTEANFRLGANSSNDQGFFTGEANGYKYYDMNLAEAANNEVALSITVENQYGTLIVPFDAEKPENVTLYSVSGASSNELTLEEENAIKANTPYIVFAGAGADAPLAGLGAAYTESIYTEGLLTGVYAETEAPVGSYVLQNQDDGVAFYLVEEDKDITGAPAGKSNLSVPANRAYLTAPAGANVRALFFPEAGDATGIAGLDVLTSGSYDAIYTANGVKVSSLQKGLNIVKKGNKSYKIFVK